MPHPKTWGKLWTIRQEKGWRPGKPRRWFNDVYDPIFDVIEEEKNPVVFEVGVQFGYSTNIWAERLPHGTIVGIDRDIDLVDVKQADNVVLIQGNQQDEKHLKEIVEKHAPNGIDLVIDDASHAVELSRETFRILMPYVKPHRFFIIEDWCTACKPKHLEVKVPGGTHCNMVALMKEIMDDMICWPQLPRDIYIQKYELYPNIAVITKAPPYYTWNDTAPNFKFAETVENFIPPLDLD